MRNEIMIALTGWSHVADRVHSQMISASLWLMNLYNFNFLFSYTHGMRYLRCKNRCSFVHAHSKGIAIVAFSGQYLEVFWSPTWIKWRVWVLILENICKLFFIIFIIFIYVFMLVSIHLYSYYMHILCYYIALASVEWLLNDILHFRCS